MTLCLVSSHDAADQARLVERVNRLLDRNQVCLVGPSPLRPAGLAASARYLPWRLELPAPLCAAFRFSAARDAMAVYSTLCSVTSPSRVEFPAAGGLGIFAVRARRAGLRFQDTVFDFRPGNSSPVRPFSEEEAGTGIFEREVAREAPAARMRNPRPISVVIPFFNLAPYLPATLASVKAQTLQPDEIIVVDDGSTSPDCPSLLAHLAQGGVKVIRKENGGLASARNVGFREARSDWVVPLDADDLLDPTFLEKAREAMCRTPSLSYVTSLVATFEDDPTQPTSGWCPWGADPDLLPALNTAGPCTGLFDRRGVLDLGGYDESLTSFEDWDLYARLCLAGRDGLILPEFLFSYRQRPGSMLRTEGSARREALRARLLEKHLPRAPHPERAAMLLLAEAEGARELLERERGRSLLRRVAEGPAGPALVALWRRLPEAVRERLALLR